MMAKSLCPGGAALFAQNGGHFVIVVAEQVLLGGFRFGFDRGGRRERFGLGLRLKCRRGRRGRHGGHLGADGWTEGEVRATAVDFRQRIALEAGGDDGYLHIIAHALVHDDAEVDLHVVVLGGGADKVAGFVDVMKPKFARSRDVDQDAARAEDAAFFHERAVDGFLSSFERQHFRPKRWRCPSWRNPCRA